MGSNRQSPMWFRREPYSSNATTMKLDRGQQHPQFHSFTPVDKPHPHQHILAKNIMEANGWRCTDFRSAPDENTEKGRPSPTFLPGFVNLPCRMSAAGQPPPSNKIEQRPTSWSQTKSRTYGCPRRTNMSENRRQSSPPLVQRCRPSGPSWFNAAKPETRVSSHHGSSDSETGGLESSWRSSGIKQSQQQERLSPRVLGDFGAPQWPSVAPSTSTTYAAVVKRPNQNGEEPRPVEQSASLGAGKMPYVLMTNFVKVIPTMPDGGWRLGNCGLVADKTATDGSKSVVCKNRSGQHRLDDLKELLGLSNGACGGSKATSPELSSALTRLSFSSSVAASQPPAPTSSDAGDVSGVRSVIRDLFAGQQQCDSPSPPTSDETAAVRFACLLGVPRRRNDSSGSGKSVGGERPDPTPAPPQPPPPPSPPSKSSCSNSLIAFIMGVGLSSDAMSDSDSDDSDWESDWDDDDEDCVDGGANYDADVSAEPSLDYLDANATESIAADQLIDPDVSRDVEPNPSPDTLSPASEKRITGCTLKYIDDQQLRFHQQLSENALREVNTRWQLEYSDVPCAAVTIPKVTFVPDDQLCTVYEVEGGSRKGQWEELARDYHRFQRRVLDASLVLDPILRAEHRQRVYDRMMVDPRNTNVGPSED